MPFGGLQPGGGDESSQAGHAKGLASADLRASKTSLVAARTTETDKGKI